MSEEKLKEANIIKVKTNLSAGLGLGDQVAAFTHATGLDNLSTIYTNVTGQDCGCKKRQAALNEMFPGKI